MKQIFLLLLTLAGAINANSQELRISGPAGFAVYSCKIDGADLDESSPLSGPANAKFFVLGDAKDKAGFSVIQYLNWYKTETDSIKIFDRANFESFNFSSPTPQSVAISKNNRVASSDIDIKERLYFAVRKSDLEKLSTVYHVASLKTIQFSLGFITMPVKMRLKNFDFSDQFSIGATAGVKWRISNRNENYLHVLGGVNIGVIDIDSTNSNPVKEDVRKSLPAKNVAVLSPAGGLVVSFSGAQIGLFFGVDYLGKSNRDKFNWIYNKKLWMAFGVGFNLFSSDKQSNATASTSQNN
jgi:hypothetical protein